MIVTASNATRCAVLALALGISTGWLGCGRSRSPSSTARTSALPTTQVHFEDGKSISVELALTPRDREIGLMNRTSLPTDYGMLFAFTKEEPLQFWMKNTLVDLDMVFIGKDKRVTEVFRNVPRSAVDTPEANLARRGAVAQYVLELPAGDAERHGLARGQSILFDIPVVER